MKLIEANDISKIYSNDSVTTHALSNVSITVNRGEFISIMGPSGSGKSTLMHILGFLDRPTSGEYYFKSKNVNSYKDSELAYIRNKEVGFVFQTFNLLPRLSVLENIKLPLIYSGLKDSERTKKAEEVIKIVGLEDRKNYDASKLSGGQKQRVAIARALVNNPAVIFADEPTGNLDSKSGEAILGFLQKLHKEGNTIVVVTHESYVAESAERMVHIIDGKIDGDEKVKRRRIIEKEGIEK